MQITILNLGYAGAIAEILRFYTSGQFVHYFGMPEDRQDDSPSPYTRWNSDMKKAQPKPHYIEPITSFYSLIEIFLFASNLANKKIFGSNLHILIKLHNQNDRILQSNDPNRWWGGHTYKSHTDTINLVDTVLNADDLLLKHDELAIEYTVKLLTFFNDNPEGLDKILETDLEKFYA